MLLTTPPDTPRTMPLVSVIVPMRDAARYVRYCVDSILRQSYGHLEILLADVGSDDDTPAILDEYRRRDHRVRVMRLDEDGVGGWRANPDPHAARTARALNAGLDAAHGEYLSFVDADGVLDRRAVELLTHALIRTDADMAKGRWERFGPSKVYEIAEQAAEGAKEPETVTSFTQPLKAYETVFCKSLRLVGDQMGHGTEARYLQEGHRCRVYRGEVWRDARFDESSAAYLERAAGELFARMAKVTDLNVRLYHLLHHPSDVSGAAPTASDTSDADASGGTRETTSDASDDAREAAVRHDHVTAAAHVYRLARAQGILPERSHAMMTDALDAEGAAVERIRAASGDDGVASERCERDRAEVGELDAALTATQRLRCAGARRLRGMETRIRDLAIARLV